MGRGVLLIVVMEGVVSVSFVTWLGLLLVLGALRRL